MTWTVIAGDVRDADFGGGFDAVLCDPPYELGFMGKRWDASGVAFDSRVWARVLAACKPGAPLMAFGGTRTYHRMTCAIEDAGFEIRDCLAWLYGSGFPKSLDVSKAIDRAAGAEREVVGGDPESNATLAGAIEKARANSMPKDNIERAIQKGTGGGADAVDYETVTYEGYGPGGVAIICVALTDNRNRTASDVRHAFTKSGSELGTPGSVAWQFERKGVILIDGEGVDEEALMDAALEAGAEDISEDGSQWQVVTDPTELAQVRGNLEGAGFAMASSDITMLPKATVATGEKEAKQLLRLLDDLEENDDVQDVYANFDISEEVMEAVAG